VVPDPGPQCRQGYAQLITMGTADIITDILLVAFPIPIVIRSQIPLKRKLSLVCLFSFSVALIVITGLRMPNVINHHGRQQYRTVWASAEILASAAVSNAIILGTFVKDRGVKKNKYRPGATLDTISRADTRRATLESVHRDSEEALFREMGVRMPRELHGPNSNVPRPAPVALSATNAKEPYTREYLMSPANVSDSPPSPHDSADALRKPSETAPSTATGQSVSFFDVGGLLGSSEPRQGSTGTTTQDFAFTGPRTPGLSRPTQDTLSNLGGSPSPTRTRSRRASGTRERSRSRPAQSRDAPASSQREREDSNTLSLQDIGGLLGGSLPYQSRREQAEPISPTTRAPASSLPPDSQAPSLPPSTIRRSRPDSANMNLQDVGGLSK
jgi:energy-converting hydrogenase Eha subunit F